MGGSEDLLGAFIKAQCVGGGLTFVSTSLNEAEPELRLASLPPFLFFTFFFLVIKYSYLYILKLRLAVHFTFSLNLSERLTGTYYFALLFLSGLQLVRGKSRPAKLGQAY